jgi:PKD domain
VKRRFLLALFAALGLLGALGATAAGDASTVLVSATVYSSSGASQQPDTVTLGSLSDPGLCPPYSGDQLNEYGRNGQQYQANEPSYSAGQQGTWALSTILQCLSTPIDLGSVTAVSIGGSASDLTGGGQPSDLSSPSDFLDTTEQPIIAYGGTAYYYRPQHTSTDLNALDAITQDPPIDIQVYEGPTLNVTATTSNGNPTKGQNVQFTATVSPSDPNAQYEWNFQGAAAPSNQQNPTTSFGYTGTYVASVQVTDPTDGAIGTGTVTEIVGTAPPQGGHHPHGGNGHHHQGPGTGPKNGQPGTGNPGGSQPGGGQPGGGTGGPTGHRGPGGSPATTNKTPQTHQIKSGQKHHRGAAARQGGGGSTGGGGSGGGANSSANGTPTASIPSYPVPASAFKTNTTTRSPTAAHHAPRSTLKSPPPSTSSPAGLIRGRLVSGLNPLPLSASPFVRTFSSPQAPATPVRAAVKTSALAAIAGGLVFLLLLGLGAGWELRGHRLLRPARAST